MVAEIQNSNYFIDDLQNAAGLEDDLFNPLPPGFNGALVKNLSPVNFAGLLLPRRTA